MFEPKSFTERRMAIVEAIMHSYLTWRMEEVQPEADEGMLLRHLFDEWQYRDYELKKLEAGRVLGVPVVTEKLATRPWIEQILRHNLGLLAVFGTGLFNPEPTLVDNDPDAYGRWLRRLENAGHVVRDTRPSEFFNEPAMVQGGMPCLKILDSANELIHVVVLAESVTIQSLSLSHLPVNWDWDRAPDAWRGELFAYLNNMTKETFLRELATAIKISRGFMWEDSAILYIPEEDPMALSLAMTVTKDLDMRYQVTRAINVPDKLPNHETMEAANDNTPVATSDAGSTEEPPQEG